MYVLVNRNDASDEMAKLLQSIVRSVKLEELSDAKRKSLEERLKKIDFNNLFSSPETKPGNS